MNLACLQRRTDHAVKSRQLRVFRVVDDDLGKLLVNFNLLFHALLACRGQLRNGNKKRSRSVCAGKTLQCGCHHRARACRVQVHHIHIKRREHRHRLFDRVRNVVELEVQEDFVTPCLDFADDGRTLGIEQLHADLHKRLAVCELIEKGQRLFAAVKIQSDDYVFTHGVHLL